MYDRMPNAFVKNGTMKHELVGLTQLNAIKGVSALSIWVNALLEKSKDAISGLQVAKERILLFYLYHPNEAFPAFSEASYSQICWDK